MTLYEFNALDELAKAQTVWDQGVFLTSREGQSFTSVLYQIDAFYAEVIYHADVNEIVKIRSFISTVPLEPYLQHIDINELFV